MLQFRFYSSSYALIGLALLLLSAVITVYLLRLKRNTDATRLLLVFFICTALAGAAMIMTNSLPFWNRLLAPWQDFWILVGGVALAQFAYCTPDHHWSRASAMTLVISAAIALVGFVYSVAFSVHYATRWEPGLNASDLYYLLLPISISFTIGVFLWRARILSRASEAALQASGISLSGQRAVMLRGLAAGLALAFLPALQTLLDLPDPAAFIVSNIGALLAVASIGLVYFSFAPEVDSFMAKLIGATLAVVVLVMAIVGSYAAYRLEQRLLRADTAAIESAYVALSGPVEPLRVSDRISYIVAWVAPYPPQTGGSFRVVSSAPGLSSEMLSATLIPIENSEWDDSAESGQLEIKVSGDSTRPWCGNRYLTFPPGSGAWEFDSCGYQVGDTLYEIATSRLALRAEIHDLVTWWMWLMSASVLLVIVLLPFIFRTTLVKPLKALTTSVDRVSAGNLGAQTPIRYNDEIGQLAKSFNTLSQQLKQGDESRRRLMAELQSSAEALEYRVADRTRELSAFMDMTVLPREHDTLQTVLVAALARIVSTGLCDAASVHLFDDDERTLHLAGFVQPPNEAVRPNETLTLDPDTAASLRGMGATALICTQLSHPLVPPSLRLWTDCMYIGCAIVAGHEVLGWLSCYRRSDAQLTVSDSSLLVAMARQLGIIIENDRLRQRIRHTAIDEERERLARDLHDSVTQLLYSSLLFNRAAQEALEDKDAAGLESNLDHVQTLSLRALGEMRALLFELQPPTLAESGLIAALKLRLDSVERRLQLAVTFETNVESRLHNANETDIYLIAIEALNNVVKHAGATQVTVSILQDQATLALCVQDDGHGFDMDRVEYGYGIRNMEQRAARLSGALDVTSRPGQGTRVRLTMPDRS